MNCGVDTACPRFDEKNEVSLDRALEYSIGSRNVLWWHCDGARRFERGAPTPPYSQTIKQWVAHGRVCPIATQMRSSRSQRVLHWSRA